MSLTLTAKTFFFYSTVQTTEDRRQTFNFCRFSFDVMLNLSILNAQKSNE